MPTKYANQIWKSLPARSGDVGVLRSKTPVDSRWIEYIAEPIHDFHKHTDFVPTKIGNTQGIHKSSQLNAIETVTAITPAMK